MGILDMARRNKMNAEKAQAFDELQQRRRDKQVYETGASDAYTDVERALMSRMQQNAMQQKIYDAARNQMFVNQDVRGPAPTSTLPAPKESDAYNGGLASAMQSQMRDTAYATALAQAQRDGKLSDEAYINQLVEKELQKTGGL